MAAHSAVSKTAAPRGPDSSSTKPSDPSPALRTQPTTLIHPTVTYSGTEGITFGHHTIIQLRTHITSVYAPLNIGDYVLLSERVRLGYSAPPRPSDPDSISIGSHTVIESGAMVEAALIGECCIIEAGARIGKGAVIGHGCKVCALVELGEGDAVKDGEVVYGDGRGGIGRRIERGMERGAEGWRLRREMAVGLEGVYRRLWTGK